MSRLLRNLLIGLGSGVAGAVALRAMLRRNEPRLFARRSHVGQAETVGLFVLGGVAAAAIVRIARNAHERKVLDEARARAELVHEHVNTRDSGMIH